MDGSRLPTAFEQLPGFVLGGFEGSSHRRRDRLRIDTIASSQHDRQALTDYRLLREMGIQVARDALRWHLIESEPGRYDWSSLMEQMDAARRTGVRVIWDLCHWGVPDHLDVMSAEFAPRFAEFCAAAALALRDAEVPTAGFVPVNEMAFWSWAGGAEGHFYPHLVNEGGRLKHQLVAAHLAAVHALRAVGARAPIVVCEPLIWVVPGSNDPQDVAGAAGTQAGAFEAVEWILEADPTSIDIVGLNYYPHNQWVWQGRRLADDDPRHRPLSALLIDISQRFGKPVLLAETGQEEPDGARWLSYLRQELSVARRSGVPLVGACIYPIMDYLGWDNDRHCPCGPIRWRPVTLQRERRPEVAAAIGRLMEEPSLVPALDRGQAMSADQ